MAINRASISKELLPGLNAVFGMEYGEVNNEHEPLYDIENSDRSFEEEVLFTGFGTAPTKLEGAAVTFDNASESYVARYNNETVALAFAITEEAMEDNLYDTFSKLRARGLARAMANTKQQKAASVFNNAFTAGALQISVLVKHSLVQLTQQLLVELKAIKQIMVQMLTYLKLYLKHL